jgi:hypothetical protein
LWLARRDPALLAERLTTGFQAAQKTWDKVFMATVFVLWTSWLVLIAAPAVKIARERGHRVVSTHFGRRRRLTRFSGAEVPCALYWRICNCRSRDAPKASERKCVEGAEGSWQRLPAAINITAAVLRRRYRGDHDHAQPGGPSSCCCSSSALRPGCCSIASPARAGSRARSPVPTVCW